MTGRSLTVWAASLAIVAAGGALSNAGAQSERADDTPRAVLDKYCVTCHNERLKTAGLMLDRLDVSNVALAPEAWETVVKKLQTRVMPPQPARRPDEAT